MYDAIFAALHNEGDGGIWEHFDATNAHTVAAGLAPAIEAAAIQAGAMLVLDKFRQVHTGADMFTGDRRRVYIAEDQCGEFLTWLETTAGRQPDQSRRNTPAESADSVGATVARIEDALHNTANDHDPTTAVKALIEEAHAIGYTTGAAETASVITTVVDRWAQQAPPNRTPQAHAVLDCERDIRAALRTAPSPVFGASLTTEFGVEVKYTDDPREEWHFRYGWFKFDQGPDANQNGLERARINLAYIRDPSQCAEASDYTDSRITKRITMLVPLNEPASDDA